jgi:hypothetical protein
LRRPASTRIDIVNFRAAHFAKGDDWQTAVTQIRPAEF